MRGETSTELATFGKEPFQPLWHSNYLESEVHYLRKVKNMLFSVWHTMGKVYSWEGFGFLVNPCQALWVAGSPNLQAWEYEGDDPPDTSRSPNERWQCSHWREATRERALRVLGKDLHNYIHLKYSIYSTMAFIVLKPAVGHCEQCSGSPLTNAWTISILNVWMVRSHSYDKWYHDV